MSDRYTGQIADDETGLYYYGGRYYDPQLGRFIQADPTVPDPTDSQSLNRYSYCRNNPLNGTDPSGFDDGAGSDISDLGFDSFTSDFDSIDTELTYESADGSYGYSISVSYLGDSSPLISGSAWVNGSYGNPPTSNSGFTGFTGPNLTIASPSAASDMPIAQATVDLQPSVGIQLLPLPSESSPATEPSTSSSPATAGGNWLPQMTSIAAAFSWIPGPIGLFATGANLVGEALQGNWKPVIIGTSIMAASVLTAGIISGGLMREAAKVAEETMAAEETAAAKTFFHYTDNPNLAGQGLNAPSFVTDAQGLTHSRALGITFLESPETIYQYPVSIGPGVEMEPLRPVMGLNQWRLPGGSPPGTIGTPTIAPRP